MINCPRRPLLSPDPPHASLFRSANAIPSRLTTPLEAEWVQAAMARGGQAPGAAHGMSSVYAGGGGVAQHYGVHGYPLHGIPDDDDRGGGGGYEYEGDEQGRIEELNFLDTLDQLLGQQQSQLQLGGGGGGGYGGSGPENERGLYAPISQLPGQQRPSMIPRAPGAAAAAASMLHRQPPPHSRMGGSFVNLDGNGGGRGGGAQQLQLNKQQGGKGRFSSARAKNNNAPSTSVAFGGGSSAATKSAMAAGAGRRGGAGLTADPPPRPAARSAGPAR